VDVCESVYHRTTAKVRPRSAFKLQVGSELGRRSGHEVPRAWVENRLARGLVRSWRDLGSTLAKRSVLDGECGSG
jgi:hypothetical protein